MINPESNGSKKGTEVTYDFNPIHGDLFMSDVGCLIYISISEIRHPTLKNIYSTPNFVITSILTPVVE